MRFKKLKKGNYKVVWNKKDKRDFKAIDRFIKKTEKSFRKKRK